MAFACSALWILRARYVATAIPTMTSAIIQPIAVTAATSTFEARLTVSAGASVAVERLLESAFTTGALVFDSAGAAPAGAFVEAAAAGLLTSAAAASRAISASICNAASDYRDQCTQVYTLATASTLVLYLGCLLRLCFLLRIFFSSKFLECLFDLGGIIHDSSANKHTLQSGQLTGRE